MHTERRDNVKRHTGRRPCEDGDRGQDAIPKPRSASSHQMLGKRHGRVSPEPSEGAGPCQHLDFGFLASRIVREYVSVVLSQ